MCCSIDCWGRTCDFFPRRVTNAATFEAALAELRNAGDKPYFIPVGGSTPLGALGYVVAIEELLEQTRAKGIEPTTIVVATGSAGTHAGIVAGLVAAGNSTQVVGISISGPTAERESLVARLALESLALADFTANDPTAIGARVRVLDQYVGAAYGQPTDGMIEAVRLVAQLEGILLDPVYTGKAMAGLIDLVRRGEISSRDTVVFWHTGGSAALYAYDDIFCPGPNAAP